MSFKVQLKRETLHEKKEECEEEEEEAAVEKKL